MGAVRGRSAANQYLSEVSIMLNDNPILSAAIRHVRLPNDMSFVIAYSGSLVHCFSGGGRGLVRKIHACIRQGAQVFEINYVAGAAEPALSRLEYDIIAKRVGLNCWLA